MIKPVFTFFFSCQCCCCGKGLLLLFCNDEAVKQHSVLLGCSWAMRTRGGLIGRFHPALNPLMWQKTIQKLFFGKKSSCALARIHKHTLPRLLCTAHLKTVKPALSVLCVCAVYVARVHAWTVRCWVCSHKAAVIGFERRGLQSASQPIPVLASGEPDFSRKGKQNTQSRTQPSLPPTRFLFSTHTHHQLQD